MNQALTIKITSENHPCYSIPSAELGFLWSFGQFAIEHKTHPLLWLSVNRKTTKKNVQEMADFLLAQFEQKLGEELKLVKTNKDLTKVITVTLEFDHACVSQIKAHIGGMNLGVSVLTMDQNRKNFKIEEVDFPVKTFLYGKGDTCAERNAEEIHKIMDKLMGGEHKTSFGVSGDGAIIKKKLIDHMNEKYGEQLFDGFGTVLFPCTSHLSFLGLNHTWYLGMDDCCFSLPTFFPNHNSQPGKHIFFFGNEQKKGIFCSYFPYWMTILKNLDTPSSQTNIKMSDYILELQRKFYTIKIRRKKKVFGAAADEEKFMNEINAMIEDNLSSADYVQHYMYKFFGTDLDEVNGIMAPKVVTIGNDPGKKSRRILEMTEKLSKVATFADQIVRKIFSDQISGHCVIPSSPFPTNFLRKIAQLVGCQKLLLAVNDASSSFNCSIYRNLCIVQKAAFNLDDQNQKFYSDVLENEFLG